ncbi:MAG TPA: GYD domain-containing protein [Usitatibacter sp.]|nr:GYD domain-containing protein [Usitatibacter sp.]
MATYIVLNNFTEQGIRNVRETTRRAEAVREMARKFGVTMKDIYWTLGEYDVVAIFESPDEASITALTLAIGQSGNVRTQMLRAFDEKEMKGVIAKLGKVKEAAPA